MCDLGIINEYENRQFLSVWFGALVNYGKTPTPQAELDLIAQTVDKIVDAKISAGGVFAYPKFLEKASEFLKGKNISESTILNAIEIAQSEIAPISDARGSEEYKRLLLSQLIKAHFIELAK